MLLTSIDAVPPAPREPTERVRALLFDLGGEPGIRAMALVAVVSALLAIPICWQIPEDLAIALTRQTQRAQLLSDTPSNYVMKAHRRGTPGHPARVLRFGFLAEGQRFETESIATEPVPPADPDDGSVLIEYAKPHPAWARVVGTHRSPIGYLPLVVLLFTFYGMRAVIGAALSRGRARAAFTNGKPALADVIRAGPDRSTKINGRSPLRVVWRFTVADRAYQGQASSMDAGAMQELCEAKQFVVLYDRDRPQNNSVYLE